MQYTKVLWSSNVATHSPSLVLHSCTDPLGGLVATYSPSCRTHNCSCQTRGSLSLDTPVCFPDHVPQSQIHIDISHQWMADSIIASYLGHISYYLVLYGLISGLAIWAQPQAPTW